MLSFLRNNALLTGLDIADEFIGLSGGFLYAGARAVVSTLWPVDDVSAGAGPMEMAEAETSSLASPELLGPNPARPSPRRGRRDKAT